MGLNITIGILADLAENDPEAIEELMPDFEIINRVLRLVAISKYLAKYLRHTPDELGLTLQPGGWVPVDDLLDAARRHGFSIDYDDLIECVETNDKKRYAFDDTGELIRANQGHSVEVNLELEEKAPPQILYHGTVAKFLPSIHATGLIRGNRHQSTFRSKLRPPGKSGRGGESP